jgi:hypothetical protein
MIGHASDLVGNLALWKGRIDRFTDKSPLIVGLTPDADVEDFSAVVARPEALA